MNKSFLDFKQIIIIADLILGNIAASRYCTFLYFHFIFSNRRREIIARPRGQSNFYRLPKYWPPIPLSARRVCTPRLCCGGRTDSPGGEGDGGSIFWKTIEIGLPSYNDLSTLIGMRVHLTKWTRCGHGDLPAREVQADLPAAAGALLPLILQPHVRSNKYLHHKLQYSNILTVKGNVQRENAASFPVIPISCPLYYSWCLRKNKGRTFTKFHQKSIFVFLRPHPVQLLPLLVSLKGYAQYQKSRKWNSMASFPKPNSIRVSESDLYIPKISLTIWLQKNRQTDPGNTFSLRYMNMEIWRQNIIILFGINKDMQFHFWQYINQNQTFILDSHWPFICSAH